jgi:PKD repeat protein
MPPKANFTFYPENPYTEDKILFNDTSVDSYGQIINWTWNFGDGNISYGKSIYHQYSDNGTYTITLNVTDNCSANDSIKKNITVLNTLPYVSFTFSPENPTDLEYITFFDSSMDIDGYIVNWTWDFGYGNISYGQNASHQYLDNNIYLVTLTVIDNDGGVNETTKNITVLNVPPTASFTYVPQIPEINKTVQFFDKSTDLDGTVVSWLWSFGDGNTSTQQNPLHNYTSFKAYMVTLNATDNDGDSHEKAMQIITKMVYEKEIKFGKNELDFTNELDAYVIINATNYTIIKVETYSGNPANKSIKNNISSIDKYININIENESNVEWPIDIKIYYTYDDLNNSNIEEDQLLGIYFWEETINEWQLYNNTGVNLTYNESGYEGYCWAKVWHLTQLHIGADAEPPTKVTGLTVSDAKDGKLDLSWSPATDNVAVDFYNIYRDNSYLTSTSDTNYRDTGLKNGQFYSYNLSSVDEVGNEGQKSDSVKGKPTVTSSGGGGGSPPSGGGGGFIPQIKSVNNPPIADAGGPYVGFVGEEISIDGSKSNDTDGEIISWEWDLDNDGEYNDAIGETTTYTWSDLGDYTIVLKVTDDQGAENTDEAQVTIFKANNPPQNLAITGETNGNKNTVYDYTFIAVDIDEDNMTYLISWGDGTNISSDSISNGTTFEANHSWQSWGIYTIIFSATDFPGAITNSTYTIYIDVHIIDNLDGYLIDNDSNGIYETYHNNTSNNETRIEQQKNGKYLIDDDGDGKWNYLYDSTAGLTNYQEKKKEGTPGFELILVIFAIALIIILKRKRKL